MGSDSHLILRYTKFTTMFRLMLCTTFFLGMLFPSSLAMMQSRFGRAIRRIPMSRASPDPSNVTSSNVCPKTSPPQFPQGWRGNEVQVQEDAEVRLQAEVDLADARARKSEITEALKLMQAGQGFTQLIIGAAAKARRDEQMRSRKY